LKGLESQKQCLIVKLRPNVKHFLDIALNNKENVRDKPSIPLSKENCEHNPDIKKEKNSFKSNNRR
jgi:hypothetical protein